MKRNLIIMAMIALCLSAYNCGGGGAGPTNVPTGENSAVPTVLQLQPVQYVAQTGSYLYLKAKVLDGNGMPVPNTTVTFTNLSGTGVLSSAGSSGTVSATTDSLGKATATLYSTVQGFVTVQASVAGTTSAGSTAAQLLSKKTVYYTDYSLTCTGSTGTDIYGNGCTQSTTTTTTTATPYILLYVDGNNNATYNENSDLTLFENSSDNQVKVLATVFDGAGGYVKKTTVTFAADSTTVTFPMGSTATTDDNGQAYVLAKVTPSTISNESMVVNITASTAGGAAGLVSLYLSPVTISSVSISSSPTTVAPDGTATVTATVKTSMGAVPDGTSVNFTSSCGTELKGTITPFAQTTSGVATATFTAPTIATGATANCYVTALSGGFTAQTTITVYQAATATTVTVDTLSISPGAVTVASVTGAQVQFKITGGYSPYTTTSTDPTKAYDSASGDGIWSGSTITVNIPAKVAAGAVSLNVYDSKGNTATASLTIIASAGTTAAALAVSPAAITVAGIADTASTADNVTFSITGGTSPYSMYSSNSAVIANGGALGGSTFTINPTAVAASTAVTLTVMDAIGTTKTVTVTVTPATGSLAINPATLTVKSGTGPVTFYIIGGSTTTATNYTIVSGGVGTATVPVNPTLTGSTLSFTVTPTVAGAVTITVIDALGGVSATSAVTVN